MTIDSPRKVALVTGATSGIGLAAAEAFLARGYAVALVDRDDTAGGAVQERLQKLGECTYIRCDVTDNAAVQSAVQQAVSKYARLDAAFNAAGIDGEGAATADCSIENWNRVIATDLTGVWFSMRHEIPAMLKTGGGAIVNCASTAGIAGAPYVPAYVAAKHGVVGLSKAAALEYARQGIRVNAVCPGIIETPMTRKGLAPDIKAKLLEETPIGRIGTAAEIAATVIWLCDSTSSYLTGQAVAVDGGWTAR
jgi:NAD(P)-dependent dehydrogenase (short-subunit alcohol dehydrogenase family)